MTTQGFKIFETVLSRQETDSLISTLHGAGELTCRSDVPGPSHSLLAHRGISRFANGAVVDKRMIQAYRMPLSRFKLSRKQQLKLVEFFVLEVTARSAADLLGIQPDRLPCSTTSPGSSSQIVWQTLSMKYSRPSLNWVRAT